MGLCKCPKRRVTNLFCFEHRVNVCEFCLVSNHSRCVVKSYLDWLQDSDYDPNCSFCQQSLIESESVNCIRLICFHVFHRSCLSTHAQSLPANTAPAGYVCPTCNTNVFPANNDASPVAETLRHFLSSTAWGRNGLGLPPLAIPVRPVVNAAEQQQSVDSSASLKDASDSIYDPQYTSTPTPPLLSAVPNPHFSTRMPFEGNLAVNDASRGRRGGRLFPNESKHVMVNGLNSTDSDALKYNRKSPFQFLSRWLRSRSGPGAVPKSPAKRFIAVIIIGVIGFSTVVLFMSKLGSRTTESDPFLDPMANPNIRVREHIP